MARTMLTSFWPSSSPAISLFGLCTLFSSDLGFIGSETSFMVSSPVRLVCALFVGLGFWRAWLPQERAPRFVR